MVVGGTFLLKGVSFPFKQRQKTNRGLGDRRCNSYKPLLIQINALPASTPFLPESHSVILYSDNSSVKWKDY